MLISVIIPSYNRADTVGKTIESILAQKVEANIEIVIGDDCSTDNAREILEHYRQNYPDIIRLFFREKNMGLGSNWAQCVKDCRGDFICNCDNDDFWHNPDKLQVQLKHMLENPECNICITNHRLLNRTTGKVTECKAFIDRTIDIQLAMESHCNFCNATIMYRSSFLKSHLDLDEYIHRRFSLQDWPTWVILTAYTNIDILPYSTATMCIETVSISRPDSVERLRLRLEKDKDICRYIGELFPEKLPFDENTYDLLTNGQLLRKAFHTGEFELACHYGKKCIGVGKLMLYCSQNKFLFQTYITLRKIVKNLTGHFA